MQVPSYSEPQGHYEQVPVTKIVDDYETQEVTTWGCSRCGLTVTSYADLEVRQEYPSDCFGMGCWFITTKQQVKVGSHKETAYENRWVTDGPDKIIFICMVCGQQKPE